MRASVSYDAVPEVAQSQALTFRRPQPRPWEDVRLQRLWMATQRRDWQSLAIMAASQSVRTLPIAEVLAQIAWCYRGQPVCVFDLRDLSLRLAEYQVREMQLAVQSGARAVVALRSLAENPVGLLVAREADAVVLCIALGDSETKTLERTIEDIGRDRVLGAILSGPA
jgi:hypothetical protein